MRILVIGGTGFIGPPVVRELARMGHSVAVFHRAGANSELPAEHILGERRDLAVLRPKADIVIDLILVASPRPHDHGNAPPTPSSAGSTKPM